MMPQAFKTAILTEYGQDALASVTIVNSSNDGHLPLGWGMVVRDGDSASGCYGLHIVVDPRFAIWRGEWQTPRWFNARGQSWSRAVLGDFGS